MSRGKILDQLKAQQESLQKKVCTCYAPKSQSDLLFQIKDLQAAKSKIPFKTVADVEAHIA